MTGVVIVGTGFGCITHLRALRSAGFDVHALVGRDPEKTARTRAPLRRSARDSRTSPTRSHCRASTRSRSPPRRTRTRPIALEAIAAGKHVLCEKPFARDARRSASDARRGGGRRASCTCSAPSSAGRPDRRRWPASSRAARSAHRSSRRSCCTSRCSPTPRARCPAWWARRRAGRRLARRAGRARDRPGARDARRARGRERVAHAGVRPRLGRRRQLHRALPHPLGRRRHHAEHGRRVGTARVRHARRGRPRHRVGGVRHGARRRRHRAHARSPHPTISRSSRAGSAARRPALDRLRRPARVRHRHGSVHALVHDVPRPDRGPTRARRSAARDLRRRPRRDAGARRDPPVGPRAGAGSTITGGTS